MKIFSTLCIGAALAGYVLFVQDSFESKKSFQQKPIIGIVQTIEHPALDQTRQGFLNTLKEKGYDTQATILYESAQSNPALALQIVQKYVGQNAAVIATIGTPATQAAVKGTHGTSIPVIFASVTDPTGARITSSVITHVTGVTNYVPVQRQIEAFLSILPFKKLGIIYNPGETNSVTILEKTLEVAHQKNVQIIKSPATKTSDVASAAQHLIGKVDAIFINNDNTALAAFESVIKVGKTHHIPIFVSDVDIVNKGALAALGADQYMLGVQMAHMLIKLLNGKKLNELNIQTPQKVLLKLNHTVAKELNITFSPSILNQEK